MRKCTFGISLVLLATAFYLFNLGSQVFAEEKKKSPIRFGVIKAQNTEFIKNYMSYDGQSIFNPAIAKEIFNEEDYIKPEDFTPIGEIAKT